MINNIDFQDVLCDYINSLNLPLVARLDYFIESDDLVVNLIAGGKVERLFMDGTQEISLPFEIAIKCMDNQKPTLSCGLSTPHYLSLICNYLVRTILITS